MYILGFSSKAGGSCTPRSASSSDFVFGSGGGATDVRIGGTSVYNRVLVAGGGGGTGSGSLLYSPIGGDSGLNGGISVALRVYHSAYRMISSFVTH